ncbi:WD40 repeat-containing protein [Crinalium epipsammum PCC 9333]|uniref:WD40 repeat-containing protein n=1 Tax=Crinalium epipsammum PCC 9333 TaxID=1173022 RepID=K9W423_9CYAN|nr:WD40 repeat domain-containing protein [Crinalium epipsammum]AFZ15098.1 WD40 repeat-containing protein [Crinalium epipsammum PCC 9333]
MNESQQPKEIQIKNARSLKTLARAIAISQGRFTLILVQCNYADLRSQILGQLQSQNLGDIREIFLPQSANKLDAIIAAEVGEDRPNAVIVLGLESVSAIDDLLSVTNQARDKFRYNFSFPLVWCVNDEILTKLIRLAPDLYSWAGVPIKFNFTTNQLIDLLQQQAEELFAQVLDPHQYRFIEQDNFNCQRVELELALEELQSRGEYLPELEASQRFILGREAYLNNDMDKSRLLYIQSLVFWQGKTQKSPGSILIESDHQKYLERQAGLLCYLGLWWRRYAVLHRAKETKAYQKARIYYLRCLRVLEQANRLDLVAKFINACGETLKQLQAWDELEQIANKAVDLYQTYPHSLKLSYAYGLLAEIAIAKSHWNEAQKYAETALEINQQQSTPLSQEGRGDIDPDLSWLQSHYESWYRLLLAKIQRYLEQLSAAESNLEIAQDKCNISYNPQLYIQILEELRCVHFQQHHYLEAFNIKSEKNSLEQQYGFRAFIGAGRLKSQRQVINPAFVSVGTSKAKNPENKQFQLGKVAQEIEASGRKPDVDNLVAKISRDDQKLIVIHGLSGVGKSSLLTAGLVPALYQEVTIDSRTPLPVILRNYNDWAQEVGSCLAAAIKQVKDIDLVAIPDKVAGIIEQLQLNIERNFLTILIFDQFEEFFFNCPNPLERRKFWEFLHLCLDRIDIGYVKVILSLREDYLHLLLEADRLTTLQVTQNDILNKEIRYYFGNFSPAQAQRVIEDLTARSFYMEPGLIDALVADLAGELKEVRPIELQVVGMQLQTEGISRLRQYQEIGNKQKLIERFLNSVIQDCGQENKRVAELLLYFLTDENNTRPPKTKVELAAALDQEANKLELVLEILVQSGLVSLIPQSPADRYQLIHDYLVAFIRQQRSVDLVAELENEREARKATEAKLDEILKEQLRNTNHQKMLKALNFSDALSASAELEFTANKGQLQPLLKVIKAGKQLQAIKAAISIPNEKQLEITARLNSIFAAMKERNSLQGHENGVNSVSFSPDGQTLASASRDKTVKLWRTDGRLITTFIGHEDWVRSVSFSPDGQTLASASRDKTVKLWRTDGSLITTFIGHESEVYSVSFSPDGQTLASASDDKTVKLWRTDGRLITTFIGA